MTMRLQEVHPATVHAPITLLPLSLTADVLGRLTGNDGLLELGRRTMPLAAVGPRSRVWPDSSPRKRRTYRRRRTPCSPPIAT